MEKNQNFDGASTHKMVRELAKADHILMMTVNAGDGESVEGKRA